MKYDRQDAFTRAYLGLASQGFERSLSNVTLACRYRGPNGLKCAIGWLMPDDKYDANMEGRSAHSHPVVSAVWPEDSNAAAYDMNFLHGLQRCHDGAYTPEHMKQSLASLAKLYNLTVPEVPA